MRSIINEEGEEEKTRKEMKIEMPVSLALLNSVTASETKGLDIKVWKSKQGYEKTERKQAELGLETET